MSLEGLASIWAKDDVIRHLLLHKGTLLQWPDPKQVGVHTFETMSLNERVITETLKLWLPQCPTPKTLAIDDARDEASILKNHGHINFAVV